MKKGEIRKLEKELDRLVKKYGRGVELRLNWEPIGYREWYDDKWQVTHHEEGRYVKEAHTIEVYSVTLEDAIETLRHEYFEYLLDEIIAPGDVLFNEMSKAFCRAFSMTRYQDKERLIESLIKHEKEDEKTEENGSAD